MTLMPAIEATLMGGDDAGSLWLMMVNCCLSPPPRVWVNIKRQ